MSTDEASQHGTADPLGQMSTPCGFLTRDEVYGLLAEPKLLLAAALAAAEQCRTNGTSPESSWIRIVDPLRFANFCLPRYFKHNKLGSFQAQMLTYGFTRIPNESCLDVSSV